MSLSIERLESEILSLPEDSKAQLLGRLLESLAAPERKDDVLQAWAEEAERRDRAMSEGRETGRPAEEVLDRLR